jgi:IS5 family transposase
MKLRPLVERIIAGLVRYNGARRARRRGLHHADFQARMCATAFNLKTWVRMLLASAQTPAQKLLPAPRPDSA